jgi:hypothetical protein
MTEQRVAARRLARMVERTDDDTIAAGLDWYPNAHDEAAAVARTLGISVRQAAGIIAVLSPGVRADIENVDLALAIGEATWDVTAIPAKLGRVPKRSVVKALRIRDGEDPADVLDARSAPKTTCFFHNIHDPRDDRWVTVDGRMADLIVNELRPWKLKRGIDSARLRNGVRTRYEEYEGIIRGCARIVTRQGMQMSAIEAQAVLWCAAKGLELAGTTKRGTPRRNGPYRTGQSYTSLERR